MLNDAIEELTKILIKQDFKDKREGKEFIKISKAELIKQNIKLLKYIQNFK